MSQYLKRLDIANFGDVEETNTQYLKRVNIVEVVDENGNPWEPTPGPDPFDMLVVVRQPIWDNGNVYEPESTIAIEAATFNGGVGEITYRHRWQWKPYGGPPYWNNTAWTFYLNTPEGITFDVPKEAQNGEVRLECEATDIYTDEEGEEQTYTARSYSDVQDIAPFPPFQVVQEGRIDALLEPGGTYIATPAIFEGGTDESTYRARWEVLPPGLDIWQLGEFQEYVNDPLLATVEYTVPLAFGGGKARIQSQARDPYVLGKNSTSREANIEVGAVTVGDFTIEGLPYVGQTITANQPMVIGGTGTYNILYDFGKGTQQNATYVVQAEDVNSMISCMVTAIDTDFNSDSKSSTNQIGNIQPALSLSPATTEINGEIADVDEGIPFNPNTTYTIVCTPHEYPNDFDITFSLRQSDGTLEQNPILSEEAVFTPAPNDINPIIMVMMTSQIAGDLTYSIFFMP